MRQKILSSIILLPLLPILFLLNAPVIENDYSLSDSFDYSDGSYLYVHDSDPSEQGVPANKINGILSYAWTKTGDIVNIFDVGNLRNLQEGIFGNRAVEPVAQTSSASSAPLILSVSNGNIGSVAKTLGATSEVFAAVGHPWFFLMTLSFGTVLLSGWFLRLSTGVSPPSLQQG